LLLLVDSAVAVQFLAAVPWSKRKPASRFGVAGAKPSSTSAVAAFGDRAIAARAVELRAIVVENARLESGTGRALKGVWTIAMPSGFGGASDAAWRITVPQSPRLRRHAHQSRRMRRSINQRSGRC